MVLGCIDGSHVAVVATQNNEKIYVNRKNGQSINIQAIRDIDNKFIDVCSREITLMLLSGDSHANSFVTFKDLFSFTYLIFVSSSVSSSSAGPPSVLFIDARLSLIIGLYLTRMLQKFLEAKYS